MPTLLLVDDEVDLLEILQSVIESEFHLKITVAHSGKEAIEKLAGDTNRKIVGIITDYNMKNGNGAMVYEYNQKDRKLPFCLLTGGFVDDYRDMGGFKAGVGGNFTLMKPIDELEVIKTIKEMLKANITKI